MQALTQLGIEWKLFLAQIVNFLVVLFILWRFAYKPVLKLLHDRTEKISKGLEDAERARKELEEIKATEEKYREDWARTSEKIIGDAREEAKKQSAEILAKTDKDAARIMSEAKNIIMLEKAKMLEEVRSDLAGVVLAATEKILREEKLEKETEKRAAEAIKFFMRDKARV